MYSEWINLLLQVELFKGIEKAELNKILFCLRPNIKSYKKKEYITIQRDDISSIGIVLAGEVIITKETLAGDRVIMGKLSNGDIFGEIAAFASKEWQATVIADTNCNILFLPSHKIIGVCPNMCLGHRIMVQNMLRIVSQKALILNKKVEILSLKSIRERVSTYLLEQYSMKESLYFEIPLKRNELAEYLTVSRPSLSRELIKMQEEAIFEFHKNSFKILNLQALKECL